MRIGCAAPLRKGMSLYRMSSFREWDLFHDSPSAFAFVTSKEIEWRPVFRSKKHNIWIRNWIEQSRQTILIS